MHSGARARDRMNRSGMLRVADADVAEGIDDALTGEDAVGGDELVERSCHREDEGGSFSISE